MFIEDIVNESFQCEICGEKNAKITVSGIEIDSILAGPIEFCRNCGPVDLEVMQLCRESATRCDLN